MTQIFIKGNQYKSSSGIIVSCDKTSDATNSSFSGTVIKTSTKRYSCKIGDHSVYWSKEYFKLYQSTI